MARGDGFSIIKRRRKGRELANFVVRVQMPAEWRDILGRKDALISTGTGDRRAAMRAAPRIVNEQYEKWELMARRRHPDQSLPLIAPTDAELEEIAVAIGYEDPSAAATRLDRLARSAGDLHTIVKQLTVKNVTFICTSQPAMETRSSTGKLLLGVLACIAEFEADIRRERQREGIEHAKAAGVYKGRKAVANGAQVRSLRDEGMGATEIAKKLGIARATVYRALSR